LANIYYGDGGVSSVTGNWNTVSNWFLTIGVCNCCGSFPGTPAGRVPNGTTDTVVITNNKNVLFSITTGPTVPYPGVVTILPTPGINGFNGGQVQVTAGNYSGVWDWSALPTGASSQSFLGISGGTFTGSFTTGGAGFASASGGQRIQVGPPGTIPQVVITGGTFSPAISATLNLPANTLTATWPLDPGFASFSGYQPVVTVTNVPALGAPVGG
jgi:hypothetical protein